MRDQRDSDRTSGRVYMAAVSPPLRRRILVGILGLLALATASCSAVQTDATIRTDPTITVPPTATAVPASSSTTTTADPDDGGDGPIPFAEWFSSTRIAEETLENMRSFVANQCFGLPAADDCLDRAAELDEQELRGAASQFAVFAALDTDQTEWCGARLLSIDLLAELADGPAPSFDGFVEEHPRCGPEGQAAPAPVGLADDCTYDGIPLSGLVFVSSNAIVADMTILEVPLRSDAQLRVWESDQPTQATGCGEWAYTDARLLADFSVYLVQSDGNADLTVFTTGTRSLAGLGDLTADEFTSDGDEPPTN